MFSRSARLYDAMYAWKDYNGEAERIDALIQERRPGATSLLDVACGTGLHLERLGRRYRCEGLDLEPELLAIARERCPDVPLHEADMVDFDLGRRFDVVTCLFSSIGYVRTPEKLGRAIAAMARHLEPGGVLLVEPWLAPDGWHAGHLSAVFVDEPDLKAARVHRAAAAAGATSIVEFHYLVANVDGVEHFTEEHELGLFTDDDMQRAFRAAGLETEHDPEGLMGRGLYIAVSG